MGQKRTKEKSPAEVQTERVTSTLEETDRTGRAPALVRENPGQFLRDMYEVWHRQGGKEGAHWRNSIRKMRDEWLVGRNAVPSLHPKLMGRVKVTRKDVQHLTDLFLERWRIAEGSDPLSSITKDGYVAFPTTDRRRLRTAIVCGVMKTKEHNAGFKLPEQSNGHEALEETKRRWVDVDQMMRDSDALITLSRHRIAVGSSNIETMKTFWHLLNHLYKNDQRNHSKNRIFIWVIDVGSRTVEQDHAFDEFFNAGFLALQFQSFATFDALNDHKKDDRLRLFPRLRIAESLHRDQRWAWLSERTVIVAQNLRIEEFDGLYKDQDMAPNSIRLKDIGVTAEHILPNDTPREWVKQLRRLYGRNIEAADATFTVFRNDLRKSPNRHVRDLRYFAHTPVSEGRRPSAPLPNVALSTRSVELQSPGQNYDDAFRLLYWAARFRLGLGDNEEQREGLTALAYVRRHGFRFLLLKDFLRIFSIRS